MSQQREETSGHTAASITGLLLIEKLAMEWLPPGGTANLNPLALHPKP